MQLDVIIDESLARIAAADDLPNEEFRDSILAFVNDFEEGAWRYKIFTI